jgi:radical SAM protein with 4Fe4S-binding SPASM domain
MLSYLRFARNIMKSNLGRLDFPYKLTFALTYWCNYKCKTCNIWQRRPKDELSLEELQSFFEKSNRFNWIDFTGGEVWLRLDFPQIVQACLRHCRDLILLHFPTNGYFTERIVQGVEEILRMQPRKLVITVSTDGDESVNDDIRGKEGGWRRQIETYRRLHALSGVEVYLGMTLSAHNVGEFDRAFAAAKTECPWLKASDFHLNIAHESDHYYGNAGSGSVSSETERVREQVAHYRSLRTFSVNPIALLERRYLLHADRYLQTGITPMRCHALRSSCFVNPWGDVYPCGMYDAKVASLREHDFDLEHVWNLERTRRFQNEIWNYQCPQCWTPCEAYQSILGNLIGHRDTPKSACGRNTEATKELLSLHLRKP